MKRFLSVVLFLVAFFIVTTPKTAAQASPTTPSSSDAERIAKVKKDLADIGVGKEITVSRKDNKDFFGRVKTIGTSDFEVIEIDYGVVQIFKYEDVKNVRSGAGSISRITGKRGNSRVKRIIGFAAVGVAVVAVVVVIKGLKDPNF